MIDSVLYLCVQVTSDPAMYGLKTVELERADGYTGWVKLKGPDVHDMEQSKKYRVTIEEVTE